MSPTPRVSRVAAPGRGYGPTAQAYERFRFGYPDAVVDQVLAYNDGPVRTAIEIGAGTGKATRVFAGRGIAVTATDPDPEMLAVLAEQCRGLPVRRVVGTLEDLPAQQPADLLYAAAALHWTADEGRWPRAAALLRPRGTFASFAAPFEIVDVDLADRVRRTIAAYADVSSAIHRPPDDDGLAWPGNELRAAVEFDDVVEVRLPHRQVLTSEAYVAYQSTGSYYLALDPGRAAAGLAALRQVLPATIEVRADLMLHLARRR
jgi:hypothetical protein